MQNTRKQQIEKVGTFYEISLFKYLQGEKLMKEKVVIYK